MSGERKPSRRLGKHWWPAGRYWIAAVMVAVTAVLAVLSVRGNGRGLLTSAAATPRSQGQATPPAPGALATADGVQRIGPVEAKALLDQGQAVLYDVRSTTSFEAGHAAGAVSLPEDQIQAQLSTLPQDKALILYCT